jgi:hypothetical protein
METVRIIAVIALSTQLLFNMQAQAARHENAINLHAWVQEHLDDLALHISRGKKSTLPREVYGMPTPEPEKPVKEKKNKALIAAHKKTKACKKNAAVESPLLSQEEQAFITIHDAAQGGYVAAQDLLAYCYATGSGTPVNEALAFNWYLCAALAGSTSARASLIVCIDQGIGTKKNQALAQLLRAQFAD